ncbi:MAG TPA: hypothetical protein VHV26_13275 [Rhizomicrobium sp.]|jgi:hypothetical protein|nr:hypothetical protein [Rhizomicrobium sp.]
MTGNLIWLCVGILTCLVTIRFRDRIFGALKRFDQQNVARMAQQQQDLSDPGAHFRHALEIADEQVELVEEIKVPDRRTGLPVVHYLFEAQVFVTREEAEQMRAARVGVVARRFYQELPQALAARGEPRSKLSARERASQRWRRTIH